VKESLEGGGGASPSKNFFKFMAPPNPKGEGFKIYEIL